MTSEAMVMVPGDVAAWVENAALSMGVPRSSVWRALVAVAEAAEGADENAVVFAVEQAMESEAGR